MDRFYTRELAAEFIGVGLRTIDRHMHNGKLRYVKNGKTPLFAEAELLRWKKEWYDPTQAGIRPNTTNGVMYNGSAAARYLGITRQGFSWHKQRGNVKSDAVRGKQELYSQNTLDELKRKMKW